MRKYWFWCALAIPLLGVAAQEAAPPGFEQWTSASLRQYDQKMQADAATDPGQAEWHETQADVFFVQSGSATLVVGGTLVNGETVGLHEKRNGTIQGGVRQKISAGDVVRIPPRVPHQLLLEGSHEFNYFVIKIKGY